MAKSEQTLLEKLRKNQKTWTHLSNDTWRLWLLIPICAYLLVAHTQKAAIFLLFFVFPILFLGWILTNHRMPCPSCHKGLAALLFKKGHPFCPHCGARAFADYPLEEKMVLAMKRQESPFGIAEKEKTEIKKISWTAIDVRKKSYFEKNSLKKHDGILAFGQPKKYWSNALGLTTILFINTMIFIKIPTLGVAFSGGTAIYLVLSVFALLYFLLNLLMLETKTFDTNSGYYSETAPFYDEKETAEHLQQFPLEDIVAIQLLSFYDPFIPILVAEPHTSYQLNLILKNGSKANCICSKYQQDITNQAQILSDALDVELITCLEAELLPEILATDNPSLVTST